MRKTVSLSFIPSLVVTIVGFILVLWAMPSETSYDQEVTLITGCGIAATGALIIGFLAGLYAPAPRTTPVNEENIPEGIMFEVTGAYPAGEGIGSFYLVNVRELLNPQATAQFWMNEVPSKVFVRNEGEIIPVSGMMA